MIHFCVLYCNYVILLILAVALRGAFSFINRQAKFSNRFIRRTWRETLEGKRECSLCARGAQ